MVIETYNANKGDDDDDEADIVCLIPKHVKHRKKGRMSLSWYEGSVGGSYTRKEAPENDDRENCLFANYQCVATITKYTLEREVIHQLKYQYIHEN